MSAGHGQAPEQAPGREGTVLALVGPTAAGKSRAALEVARRRGAEIVAVDAFTVYRGMDVGTAKPSSRERADVPHHMVDVLDPWEEVSVAWFQGPAREAVAGTLDRGRTPLLVGGSGLYFHAVVDDLRFPPTDPGVRRRLRARYAHAPEQAHAALVAADPAAAAGIDPHNLRRSVRALEVIELTGRPFSAYGDSLREYRSIYPGLRVLGLDLPDGELKVRIAHRSRAMVAGGLLEEARSLRSLPRALSRTARQAIGYREAFAVLDGEMEEGRLAEAITRRTWRYARRQRAWFRKDPRIRWVSPEEVLAAWA